MVSCESQLYLHLEGGDYISSIVRHKEFFTCPSFAIVQVWGPGAGGLCIFAAVSPSYKWGSVLVTNWILIWSSLHSQHDLS